MTSSRRYAAHHISLEGQPIMDLGMVEISGMEVVAWQPLLHEMPFTEWIGGCIDIRCTPDGMRAYKDGTLLKGTK